MMGQRFIELTHQPATSAALSGDDLAAAATAYAELGLPVFPVHSVDVFGRCSCCTSCGRNAGKHPRTANGLRDATCDLTRVGGWWGRWPEANVAVATGTPSGVWVLDVDPAHGGLESLEALEARHEELEPTWCVETGGSGLHLWFLLGDDGLRNSVGRLGPGLDIRAEGGYVVAPPSRHRTGQPYRWADGWHPTRVDLASAPPWFIALAGQVTSPRMVPPDGSSIGDKVGGNHPQPFPAIITKGARNATLTSLAGAMRRKGCGERAIVAALLVENVERCRPPLPESEIAAIARSVSRYAPAAAPRLARSSPRSPRFVEFVGGKAVVR